MKKIIAAAGLVAVLSLAVASPANAAFGKKFLNLKGNSERNGTSTVNANASSTVKTSVERKQIQGVVTAVATGTISVALPNGGNWTVNVSSDDKITSANGLRIFLSQIKVGDRVIVSGQSSASSVMDASVIKDVSIHLKKSVLRGVVSNISSIAKSFTLTLKNGSSVNVSLADDAEIKLRNSSSTATSTLQNGMVMNVKGLLNKASSTMVASEVKGGLMADANPSSTSVKAKLYGWLKLGL